MALDLLTKTRELFGFIERGDAIGLASMYAENAVQIEHPNRLKPNGDRRSKSKMIADLGRGKKILSSERYDVINAVVSDASVAVQVNWTGVLAVPVGALSAGDTMRTFSGIFLRFEGSQIVEQHNYDCFEDFWTPRT